MFMNDMFVLKWQLGKEGAAFLLLSFVH